MFLWNSYKIQVDQEEVAGISPLKEGKNYLLPALPVLKALGAKIYPVKSQPQLLITSLGNRWVQCKAGDKKIQYRLDRSSTELKTAVLPVSPKLQKNTLLLPLNAFAYLGVKTSLPNPKGILHLEGGMRQKVMHWAKSLGISDFNRFNRSSASVRLVIAGGQFKRQSQNIILYCITSQPGYLQLFEVVENDVAAVLSQEEDGRIYYYLNEEASMVKAGTRCRVKLSVGGDKIIQFIAVFTTEKISGNALDALHKGSFKGDVTLSGTQVHIQK